MDVRSPFMTRRAAALSYKLLTGLGLTCLVLGTVLFARAAATAAALPDGRVWELVSPPDKNGGEVVPTNIGVPGPVQATPDGNEITYLSRASFTEPGGSEPQGAPLASQYLAKRSPSGWRTENITLPMSSATYALTATDSPYRSFSTDLSQAYILSGNQHPVQTPPLVAGAPQGYENIYLRDNLTGALQTSLLSSLSGLPQESEPAENPAVKFTMPMEGATPDGSHVVVRSFAALSPGSVSENGSYNVYEWTAAGGFQAVNVLPGVLNGATLPGATLGSGRNERNTISSDGSRVYWASEAPSPVALYLREIGVGSVQVDASEGGSDTTGGSGIFQTASADGRRAFFTDQNRLTPDSTAGHKSGDGEDLYEFALSGPGGTIASGHSLHDLTVDEADPDGAGVLGVVGASEDGSYVYFVADGVLASGASLGDCEHNGDPSTPCNLYVRHDEGEGKGKIDFIAQLTEADDEDWNTALSRQETRVSANGQQLVFVSKGRLTAYDNTDATTKAPDAEVYRYDSPSEKLSCLSCNPSGAAPIGAAKIPTGTIFGESPEAALYQPRVVSLKGARVFFDSSDTLTAQAANHRQNVYEWEQDEEGSCREATGCVYLISGGSGSEDANFIDASAEGGDVFFRTGQQLVAGDTDNLADLYDARIGGGFPEPTPAPAACEGEPCLGAFASPPPASAPSSSTFSGAGNLSPAGSPSPPTARLGVTVKRAKGSALSLDVSVSGAGRIRVSGAGVRPVAKSVAAAGRYALTMRLTAGESRLLEKRRRLKLKLRVLFSPVTGKSAALDLAVTTKA